MALTDEELIKALRKMASWLRKEGAAEAATAATAASRLEALSRSGGAVREAVERDIATRLFAQDCMVLKNPFAVKDELGAAITDCFDIQPSAEDMAKFIASLRSILSEAALAAAPDPRKDYWQAVLAAASKWEDRALLSAAPPPPAPESAWRPIESAPKDGTRILLFADSWGETFGEWQIAYWDDGAWVFDSGMNIDAEPTFDEDNLDFSPTHWMPLPTPPATSEPSTDDPWEARRILNALRSDEGSRCRADQDGDCSWPQCPQNRDGEPQRSGRHCPLDSPEPSTEDPHAR